MTDEQLSMEAVERTMPGEGETHSGVWQRVGPFTGEVHPLADRWPMMEDQELDALAADIAAHGLREPIVVDEFGRLVDGRNRLAACLRADVEPRFATIPAAEARSYIFSRNAQRRNTTSGQRAMIAVVDCWNAELSRLDSSLAELATTASVSPQRIAEAVLVVKWQPGLVDRIISGREPMTVAYRKAQSAQQDDASEGARYCSLKNAAPDLAEQVSVGKITLEGAEAELSRRTRERHDRVTSASRRLASILNLLDPVAVPVEQAAREWLLAQETATTPSEDFSLARIERAAAVLRRYLELREESNAEEEMATR